MIRLLHGDSRTTLGLVSACSMDLLNWREEDTLRLFALVLLVSAPFGFADSFDAKLFAEMRWRMVGPFRGGRTRAISGVPSQPNVFYIGAVNGGVWKTND